jgi:hypothetical protein
MQEDLVLSKKYDYYIGDIANGFVSYKKSNILKLYPQHKSEIGDYLESNAVDFKLREDLIRLTEFIRGLRQVR